MNQVPSNQIPDFLLPGTLTFLGKHTFEEAEIIEFATQFDPQHFHVNPEAAKSSMLGGLCASGWHTMGIWMRLQRQSVAANTERLMSENKPYPEFGPSPGVKGLKWLKPVYSGDEVSFSNTIIELRNSNTRPPWKLLRYISEGTNQAGQRVMEFESTVFLKLHLK